MPATVSHALSMTTPNDPAYENQPKHWNSSHLITLNAAGSEISAAFSNSNGLSFGTEAGGGITGSYTVPTATAYSFANSNGVSFGTNGSTVTATVQTNYQSSGAYLTTARASNDGVGLNTAQTNVTWTVNSSGISLNAGGYNGTGFTSTTTAGTAIVATNNTVGLSMGVPAYITTARNSNDGVGLNTALTGNGVTWTVNSSGISLNVPAFLTTADLSQNSSKYAGINGAITGGSITVNTSGVSINLPAYLTTAALSTEGIYALGNTTGASSSSTFDARTLSIQGTGAVSVGFSNGSLVISGATVAAGNVSFSAGTSSAAIGSVVFSNSNNVSFGLNGSTITGSVLGATLSVDWPNGAPGNAADINISSLFSTIFLEPYAVNNNVTMTRAGVVVSMAGNITSAANNTTYSGTYSWGMAFYSYNGTNLTRASSGSSTQNFTYTSDNVSLSWASGGQEISMAMNANLTPGNWWIAFSHSSDARRSAAGGSSSTTVAMGHFQPAALSQYRQFKMQNQWGAGINVTDKLFPFVGYWSASNAFPVSIANADVSYGTKSASMVFPQFILRAI